MIIQFESLEDYFFYHRKDKKVTVKKVAESLRETGTKCSTSFLYMLIAKTRNAGNPLACKIEELLNVSKESLLKKPPVHKSYNWRKNIFKKNKYRRYLL